MKYKRTGKTTTLSGYGLVIQGGTYYLDHNPGSGWQRIGGERLRVTEPAPSVAALTVRELRDRLRDAGVPVPAGAVKADLIRLLQGR